MFQFLDYLDVVLKGVVPWQLVQVPRQELPQHQPHRRPGILLDNEELSSVPIGRRSQPFFLIDSVNSTYLFFHIGQLKSRPCFPTFNWSTYESSVFPIGGYKIYFAFIASSLVRHKFPSNFFTC
jgi:hypothetical protein